MPRAYDRRQLVIDRNPLNQLSTDLAKLPKLDPFNLDALWEALVDVIKQLTQIDLHTPATLVASIIHLLGGGRSSIEVAIDDLLRDLVKSITGIPPANGLINTALHGLINEFTKLLPKTIHEINNGYDPHYPEGTPGPPDSTWQPTNIYQVHEGIQQRLNDNEDDIFNFIISQTALNFSGNSGNEKFRDYSPGISLGVAAADAQKWVQTYPSGTTAGYLGVNGRNAAWAKNSAVAGSCIARYAKTVEPVTGDLIDAKTKTDIQRVGITMASSAQSLPLTSNPHNYIYGRMNAAGTQYIFARLSAGEAVIGYVNGGGPVEIGKVQNFTMKAGATYWLDIGFDNSSNSSRRTYTLWENNKSLQTFAEVGNGSALDAIDLTGTPTTNTNYGNATSSNNKYTGFGMSATFSNALIVPLTLFPAPVSSFGMLDNLPAQVRGSGIQLTRTLTGNSGVPAGGNPAYVPNNYFNRTDYITADYGLNTTTSEVTVSIPGWYVINWMAGGSNGNVALAGLWRLCLFKNGAAANNPTFDGPQGNWGLLSVAPGVQLTTTTYLNKGDRIRPGWESTTGFNQQASNTGKDTYFQVTFLQNTKPT